MIARRWPPPRGCDGIHTGAARSWCRAEQLDPTQSAARSRAGDRLAPAAGSQFAAATGAVKPANAPAHARGCPSDDELTERRGSTGGTAFAGAGMVRDRG